MAPRDFFSAPDVVKSPEARYGGMALPRSAFTLEAVCNAARREDWDNLLTSERLVCLKAGNFACLCFHAESRMIPVLFLSGAPLRRGLLLTSCFSTESLTIL